MSNEPASEQILISEVDETGAALAAAEIETELRTGNRINPWLLALWVGCLASAALFVLALMGAAYSYPIDYSANYPNMVYLERPWYTALASFAQMFLIMFCSTVLCVLVLHAVFWERRRDEIRFQRTQTTV